MGKSSDPPAPPPMPTVPGLTAEERDVLQKQGQTYDQLNQMLSGEAGQIEENRGMLQQFSGMYNPDGTINQEAVASLQGRIAQQQQLEETLGGDALRYLQGSMDPTQFETASGEAGQLELDRYMQALRGERPTSAMQQQLEQDQFRQLKETAARRGIRISGDDVFTATSNSTAGNQLLADLRRNAESRRFGETEAIIAQGGAQNLNRLGFGLGRQQYGANLAQSLRATPGGRQMPYLDSSFSMGPATLFPSMMGLGQGYGALAAPYADQRRMQYQRDMQNYATQYQYELQKHADKTARENSVGSMLGGGAGAIIGGIYGNAPGAVAGYGIGSSIGGTLFSGQQNNQSMGMGLGMLPYAWGGGGGYQPGAYGAAGNPTQAVSPYGRMSLFDRYGSQSPYA